MHTAPLPANEEARMKELYQYEILDTAAEADLDDLTLLAARLCHTPIALISLVDHSRLWFKSKVGLDLTETSRAIAFCGHAILHADVFVVSDALADHRFADNPLVTGELGIRFYAGAPLVTPNGYPLGTLCVIDRRVRQFDADQCEILRALGRQAVRRLEQRRQLKELQRVTAERARVEDTLKRTTAQLEAVIACSPLAIVMLDCEGLVRLWNPAATRLFGWTAEEVAGRPNPVVPKDKQEEYRQVLRRGLQNEPMVKQELLRQRKDGTLIEVALSTAPLHGPDGRIYGLMGILEDITDRKRMERVLQESHAELECRVAERTAELLSANVLLNEEIDVRKGIERQLQLTQYAVDHAADHIFIIASDGSFLNANESACSRLGYTKQELLARSVMDITPDMSSSAWGEFWAALKGKKQIQVDTIHRGKTGEIYPVEMTANYLRHNGREFNYVIARDITGRKQAETSLRAGEARFRDLAQFQRAIMHTITEGLFVLDAQGLVTYVNPAAEALLGWPAADLVGRSMHEAVHYQHTDGTPFPVEECPIYAMLHGGSTPKEQEDLFIRKDGTFFNVILSCAPLPADRQAHGLVVLFRDVTARKRAEELLRHAAAERERISQDLHDGILQSLYAVGLGLEACKPLLDKDPVRAGDSIDGVVHHLNRLMSEIRQFITGLEVPPLSGQDLSVALRDTVASLSEAQRTRVRWSVDGDAAEAVSSRQGLHILHVVKEAISNAVRHGRATDASVTLKLVKHGVRLAIRDSGIGFNPKRVGGEGRGLANMAARARQLGGQLSVASKPKVGTRIVLNLPRDPHGT